MAKKDRGWEFLSSKDEFSLYDEETGDWGSSSSDGSACYYGADGSWGSKEPDGSGCYYGADGSWGYKDPDGSGSYYGADGSWGTIDADGSTYYHDEEGDCSFEDANPIGDESEHSTDSDEDEMSSAEALGTLIGYGISGIISARRKRQQKAEEREAERKEAEREHAIRTEYRRKWMKEHIKLITAVSGILVCLALIMTLYAQLESRIPMTFSEDELTGLQYAEVIQKLKESGFSNIHAQEISDLTISRESETDLVTDVNLRFLKSFDEETLYPSDMRIEVVYHTLTLYNPPMTHKMAKGMNYLDVIKQFKDKGFTNVSTEVEYDIITGWLAEDGEVKSLSINGNKNFEDTDKFRLDAEVVIIYHTLRSNKP